MERYPRLFIIAAISYLLSGVLLGVGLGIGLLDAMTTRFIHIHLNLLGFMAMFIYGVAYHILPRFNAKPLAHPGLMGVHFYLVNIGLIGMVTFSYFDGLYGSGITNAGFVVSSLVESVGIFIFAFNVLPVIWPEAEEEEDEDEDEVASDMKVAHVLEKWPGLIDTFGESGFKALANPIARATFGKAVTVSQACKIHGVDLDGFIEKLNQTIKSGFEANGGDSGKTKPKETPEKKAADAMAKGKTIKHGEPAVADTLIGSLIETYPETKKVFSKNYGEGCFSCPGQAFETVGQTAMMHGVKAEKILDEINEAIESTLAAK